MVLRMLGSSAAPLALHCLAHLLINSCSAMQHLQATHPPLLPLLFSPHPRRCAFSGGHSDDGFEVQPVRASLQLRGAGTVLCYASHPPTSVAVAGQEVAFEYDAPAAALRFELPALGSASAAKDCSLLF